MALAGELVSGAVRAATGVLPGEPIDGGEAENALAVLNALLAAWSADDFLPPAHTLEPFALTPGVGTYTVGPSGLFNTARPDKLTAAFLRETGTDTPVEVIPRERWLAITDKSTQGTPEVAYLDPTYPFATLQLYPVPDRVYTLYLDSLKPLAQLSSMAATVLLPGQYYEAIKYAAAERLCVEYKLPVTPDLAKLVRDSVGRVRKRNARVRPPTFDPMLRARGGYDINSGSFR